ncbi:MAG: SCO family protein [Deltaproteobacteria bacterium]|nr:SCO family protein [Deltaproteobacteria bacterium]
MKHSFLAKCARASSLVAIAGACLGLTAGHAMASGYNGHYKPAPIIGGGEGNVKSQDIEPVENLGQSVPANLAFVDGHGKSVALSNVLGQGKPVLVTIGYYTCPMLCNLVHEGLAKSLKKAGLVLGRDFLGFSVSVDPKEDAKSANTNQGRLLRSIGVEQPALWPFLMVPAGAGSADGQTGPAKELSESLGFRYVYDKESKQFAHAAVAFVLTPEGKISRYLYGVDFDPRDLKFALVEAGGGRVGTTLDRVLLSCFKYDPMTHKYTPFAFGFVRIGAFLSFVALASLLALLWRKELQIRQLNKARRTA